VTKTIHQIWLQGGELPDPLAGYVRGVRALCEAHGWTWRLWSAADVAALSPESQAMLRRLSPRCCHVSQQSNLLRWLVLRDFGGLYFDTDTEPLKLPACEGVWIAPTDARCCKWLASPVACPAHDPWIEAMVATLDSVDLAVHMSAGPLLVAQHTAGANAWAIDDWRGRYGRHHCLGRRMGHFTAPPVEVPT
jgi:Glycosyltransferase sugar-binding region containing DXD motif